MVESLKDFAADLRKAQEAMEEDEAMDTGE